MPWLLAKAQVSCPIEYSSGTGARRLSLTADDLLSTTRAVRKRLDFDRDVEPELIKECIRLAQQAPSAYNTQSAHFVVVTDADKKAVLAELWRRGRAHGRELPISWVNYRYKGPEHAATAAKMVAAASYLAENLHRAPAIVIPCVTFRTDNGESVLMQSLVWVPYSPRSGASASLRASAAWERAGPPSTSPTNARPPSFWASRTTTLCQSRPAPGLHERHRVQARVEATDRPDPPLEQLVAGQPRPTLTEQGDLRAVNLAPVRRDLGGTRRTAHSAELDWTASPSPSASR